MCDDGPERARGKFVCAVQVVPRTMRIDAFLRRQFSQSVAVIALFCIVCYFTGVFTGQFRFTIDSLIALALLILLMTAGAALANAPRVRIDEHGLTEIILWYRNLWPWDAFRSGTICQYDNAYSWFWPDRPSSNKFFSIRLLGASDIEYVLSVLRTIWVEAPRPKPNSLSFRIGALGWTQLHLSEQGITIHALGVETIYAWREVESVFVNYKAKHSRMVVKLPDRVLRIRAFDQRMCGWQGATGRAIPNALEVRDCLLYYVPQERVTRREYEGCATEREGLQHQFRRDTKSVRRTLLTLYVLMSLVLCLWSYLLSWNPQGALQLRPGFIQIEVGLGMLCLLMHWSGAQKRTTVAWHLARLDREQLSLGALV